MQTKTRYDPPRNRSSIEYPLPNDDEKSWWFYGWHGHLTQHGRYVNRAAYLIWSACRFRPEPGDYRHLAKREADKAMARFWLAKARALRQTMTKRLPA